MADLTHVSSGDPGHAGIHNAERDVINNNTNALANKISKPGGPPTGSLLRFDGTSWVASTTRLFEGSGDPNGSVSGPPGSRYVDTSAETGAVEYVKKSGSGSSGWILIVADTGWRDVHTLVSLRGTGICDMALLRRVNFMVELYLDLTVPTNDTSPWTVLNLPAGFRPDFGRFGTLQDNNEAAASGSVVNASDGAVNLLGPSHGKRDRWTGLWTTQATWPSSLPGTAWTP